MAETVVYELVRPLPEIGGMPGDVLVYAAHEAPCDRLQLVREVSPSVIGSMPWGDMRELDRQQAPEGKGRPRLEVLT